MLVVFLDFFSISVQLLCIVIVTRGILMHRVLPGIMSTLLTMPFALIIKAVISWTGYDRVNGDVHWSIITLLMAWCYVQMFNMLQHPDFKPELRPNCIAVIGFYYLMLATAALWWVLIFNRILYT